MERRKASSGSRVLPAASEGVVSVFLIGIRKQPKSHRSTPKQKGQGSGSDPPPSKNWSFNSQKQLQGVGPA